MPRIVPELTVQERRTRLNPAQSQGPVGGLHIGIPASTPQVSWLLVEAQARPCRIQSTEQQLVADPDDGVLADGVSLAEPPRCAAIVLYTPLQDRVRVGGSRAADERRQPACAGRRGRSVGRWKGIRKCLRAALHLLDRVYGATIQGHRQEGPQRRLVGGSNGRKNRQNQEAVL